MKLGQAYLDALSDELHLSAMNETHFMQLALQEATAAASRGEVPVGAVIVEVSDSRILARTGNQVVELSDPTAHAEILAIRAAGFYRGEPRLQNCDLYVTLEPCAMCAAAIGLARIRKLIFGAYDPKGGGVEHGPRIFSQKTINHVPEIIGGVLETDSAELLKDFFRKRRPS